MPSGKPTALAVDFGTSNSLCAAASADEVFEPIPLDPGAPDPAILRSLLFFPSQTKVFFGSEAVREFNKRSGEGRLLRSLKKFLPMRSFIGTFIEDRPANLEDLIGFFLAEIRRRAAAHFGQDITRVLLGRPAKFAPDDIDDKFAQFRLEQSAKRAGFTEIEFCPEPLAAAYEYGATEAEGDQVVLVADLGGGTSDFTVIRWSQGKRAMDVLGMGGVSVAGDALDGEVMRHKLVGHFGADLAYRVPFGTNVMRMPGHLMEKLCSPADIALLGKRDIKEFLRNLEKWTIKKEDKVKLDRLVCLIEEQLGFPIFETIEGAKRELSEADSAKIRFDYPRCEISEAMTRAEFDRFIEKSVGKVLESLDETLKAAGLTAAQIDRVCCTGGTAQVPAIHQELVKRFGAAKIQQRKHFRSVVEGLSYRAKEWVSAS